VAGPARGLPGRAAGGRGGREIAANVTRDGADGPVRRPAARTALAEPRVLARAPALLGPEVVRRDERHPLLLRERDRAVAFEIDVRRALHDPARERDGILDAAQVRDGAGRERTAVHDRRLELVRAASVEHGALARVEQRRVLERADRVLDDVD